MQALIDPYESVKPIVFPIFVFFKKEHPALRQTPFTEPTIKPVDHDGLVALPNVPINSAVDQSIDTSEGGGLAPGFKEKESDVKEHHPLDDAVAQQPLGIDGFIAGHVATLKNKISEQMPNNEHCKM
jgi:hypothetical protein